MSQIDAERPFRDGTGSGGGAAIGAAMRAPDPGCGREKGEENDMAISL